MTYTALARFGRISRGVPRAVFSFTITRYLVRMKRKSCKNRKEWEKLPRTSINANLSCFWFLWTFKVPSIMIWFWWYPVYYLIKPLPCSYTTHTHAHTPIHTYSLCFGSREPLVRLSPNFVCVWCVTRQSHRILRSSWYEAILTMQMKVKVQTPLGIVFQQPLVQSSPNFVCICSWISQSYYIITSSWYEAILAMQMKVKGQIPFCFVLVSQEPLVRLSPNFDML